MARRGGFNGGGIPGNMSNLMKQAQRMQRQMEDKQKELETKEYTASAGGGAVEVTVTGKKLITKLTISPDAVDPDDVEMLQDMVIAAVNEAVTKAEEESNAFMTGISSGLDLGGMPF
ncbi:MAG: YbaB/EbfC family nucleoid-associated protein [Lachnospiraceae bacterium]|nr:YbaB/EbfC family nucleoid-associated protein [Lachnospiraceae bacterium]